MHRDKFRFATLLSKYVILSYRHLTIEIYIVSQLYYRDMYHIVTLLSRYVSITTLLSRYVSHCHLTIQPYIVSQLTNEICMASSPITICIISLSNYGNYIYAKWIYDIIHKRASTGKFSNINITVHNVTDINWLLRKIHAHVKHLILYLKYGSSELTKYLIQNTRLSGSSV